MWHELVLCGIGGATIEEAKQKVTYAEFLDWVEFRKMRGSLFMGNRLESGFALLAYMVDRKTGGRSEMKDFMPHFDEPEQDFRKMVAEFNRGRK